MDRANANWCLLAAIGLSACAPPAPLYPELPRLAVSTTIGSKNMCGLGVSPAIAIGGAPAGTSRYAVQMTNIDVLYQQPWRATLPAVPSGIAEAAATSYDAPCLGERQTYRYRIEVTAQDSTGRSLGYGQTLVQLFAIDRTVTAERERGQRPRLPAPVLDTADPIDAPETLTTNPATNPVVNPALNPTLNPTFRSF